MGHHVIIQVLVELTRLTIAFLGPAPFTAHMATSELPSHTKITHMLYSTAYFHLENRQNPHK